MKLERESKQKVRLFKIKYTIKIKNKKHQQSKTCKDNFNKKISNKEQLKMIIRDKKLYKEIIINVDKIKKINLYSTLLSANTEI